MEDRIKLVRRRYPEDVHLDILQLRGVGEVPGYLARLRDELEALQTEAAGATGADRTARDPPDAYERELADVRDRLTRAEIRLAWLEMQPKALRAYVDHLEAILRGRMFIYRDPSEEELRKRALLQADIDLYWAKLLAVQPRF